jgi:hypothetical protein
MLLKSGLDIDDPKVRDEIVRAAHRKRGPFIPKEKVVDLEMLKRCYEDATGLDARRGRARIENLANWTKEHGVENFQIFNDTDKIRRDWEQGTRWYAGTQHGDTILLGYTSGRGSFVYKNAIFAQSDEIYLGE